jgi:diaminohydroxyphosphoribosylaminopyrimidine deaminase/5-amino-6-(5-phosphoribosylamino)uracil reductase
MSSADDHRFMARAVALAERGSASTSPNPAVGCVIVKDAAVLGEGFTQRAGGNHAEIEALGAAGPAAAGATCYVSLEPCAHQGRTGPCTEALIRARIARVVFAVSDPNPHVAGNGADVLRAAGIEVEAGLLEAEARRVNRGFFSRMERRRPWVRLKLAASLDGRTALANGLSQWITGEAARRDVHRWRARSSAIMTGVGTILADNPRLSARADDIDIDVVQPARVIVDTHLRTPPTARTLDGEGEVVIFSAGAGAGAGAGSGAGAADAAATAMAAAAKARREALEQAGARVESVPLATQGDAGTTPPRCDLGAVMQRLAALEINDVWLEAGSTLAGAMLVDELVDELVLYLAPCLLGDTARGLVALPELTSLQQRRQLAIDDLRKIGDDLRIVARPVAH